MGRLRERGRQVIRRTDEELNWFLARMRAEVEDSQSRWAEDEHEPQRWFSRLRLTSADIDADKATFLFIDDADGRRYGYRWWLHGNYGWDALTDPDDSLLLFAVHLEEHVAGCELIEGWPYRARPPDRDGVQWFSRNPPAPSPELAFLKNRLRDVMFDYMLDWDSSKHLSERRFSHLKLVFGDIGHDAVTFVLADREGRQYGYRWPIRDDITGDPGRAAGLFAADLRKDVERLGHGDPDADGIRWFSSEPPAITQGPPRR